MNLTGQGVYQKGQKRTKGKPSDRTYLDWLKRLSCCVCHRTPCDPAHVRLNGRGGMGQKPLFSAVPLCRTCHMQQHTQGHSSIMPSEQWIELADFYLRMWKDRK